MTVRRTRKVRRVFLNKGIRLTYEQAKLAAKALPTASVATGWSEEEVLDVVTTNYHGGALDRLLAIGRPKVIDG